MESAAILNDSGIALTEANRALDAIPLFQKALSLEPTNPLIWFNLGVAQERIGDFEAAVTSFQQALSLDPSLAEAWSSIGLIYYKTERFDEAEQLYYHALGLMKEDPKTWNNLGVLYFTQGNYEEARKCFEEALRIFPLFYDALFNVRDTCYELGEENAAREYQRRLDELGSFRNYR